MSTSGSFTGSVPPPPAQHTDTDDTQNPTYFSIPEAQSVHQQYKAAQVSAESADNYDNYISLSSEGNSFEIIHNLVLCVSETVFCREVSFIVNIL